MTITPLGKFSVGTPGSPVPVAAAGTLARRVEFAVWPGNDSIVFVGLAGMNINNGTGVIRILNPAPGSGVSAVFCIEAPESEPWILVSGLFIDGPVIGDGVLVTLFD